MGGGDRAPLSHPGPCQAGTRAGAAQPQPPLSSAKATAPLAHCVILPLPTGPLSQQPCPQHPLPSRNLLQELGS